MTLKVEGQIKIIVCHVCPFHMIADVYSGERFSSQAKSIDTLLKKSENLVYSITVNLS
jgi:hypothetical protein